MASFGDAPGIAMQVSRDVVVASIQVDLTEHVLARFREDLLARLHETGCRGVILDLSGLETLDSVEFASLRRIMTMVTIMGAKPVLAGIRPGVVSALIDSGVELGGLRAAIDLDAAFTLLEPDPTPEPEPGEDLEDGDDVEEGPAVPPPPERDR